MLEAGNEAEGESGEEICVRQVAERLTDLGGGVGGVDIHVGGAATCMQGELGAVVNSSGLLMDEPASDSGFIEEMDVVGVQTGDAVIEGRGRKPHIVNF